MKNLFIIICIALGIVTRREMDNGSNLESAFKKALSFIVQATLFILILPFVLIRNLIKK